MKTEESDNSGFEVGGHQSSDEVAVAPGEGCRGRWWGVAATH